MTNCVTDKSSLFLLKLKVNINLDKKNKIIKSELVITKIFNEPFVSIVRKSAI